MKTLHIKQVNAFTTQPFTGNPAGVVLNGDGLSDHEMQTIAREINNPETAFILKSNNPAADVQIRWFSPTAEVPLCGHATIASFFALAESKMLGMHSNGQHYFRLLTKSGILSVRVEKNFHGTSVEFELPIFDFRMENELANELQNALSIADQDIDKRFPIVSSSYLFIPVKTISALHRLKPNYASLKLSCEQRGIAGISVFTLETLEPTSAFHSRFFDPALGVDEDPVTGSANGPLGAYFFTYVIPQGQNIPSKIVSDGRIEFIGEQGDCLSRRGRVRVRLQTERDKIKRICICGDAVTVFETTITLND